MVNLIKDTALNKVEWMEGIHIGNPKNLRAKAALLL